MKCFLLSLFASALLGGANAAAHSAVKGTGSTTRGWSCCKNSCSWANKAPVNSPVISCDATDNLGLSPARRDGCESGGGSYACSDLSPWAVSNDLSYGYAGVNLAATNETAWCCSCYQLSFTSGPVNGKKMIVQVVNSGTDLGNDQFDLAIPGGGQGNTQGCSVEWGKPDIWGAPYGGVAHREDCDAFPDALKGGCYWRFDWFRNSDNPTVTWEKVTCPEALSYVSGCRRNDDPLSGNPPTPTSTKSAPIASGTVSPGGQCGGRRYNGPTICTPGNVCTYVSDEAYYCLPDPANTRTTPTITKPTNTPMPTVGLVWDQCGGKGWTGPTRCKDSQCVYYDEYWSQCQPYSGIAPPPPAATPTPPAFPGWPGRPRPSWPPAVSSAKPPVQPTPTRASSRAPTTVTPPKPSGTIAQLYEQCGGLNHPGPFRCAQGLSCVYVDDYYSQCQKPGKKRGAEVLAGEEKGKAKGKAKV
ncbi:carbohydrate-binding module family 1 protein [Melanomma pulvis-pyrius CBS 109.77]|uniref:cellulase n=1 Tax=Melanomma pulvis-pyrius CBS 109.77 TaxID=1314802 RepID=A0A6A6WYU4_9PLEO|nr:carbohydrate-binding module family 1 protein [Melanomma pulvis-pyrius CBS 109.77]